MANALRVLAVLTEPRLADKAVAQALEILAGRGQIPIRARANVSRPADRSGVQSGAPRRSVFQKPHTLARYRLHYQSALSAEPR